MSKITKKIYIHKFKKTKLYKNKKTKKQTLYNLNGGNKAAVTLFFNNFDTIKDYLKKEIDKLDINSITIKPKKAKAFNETEKVLNNTKNALYKKNKAFNDNLNILNEVVKKVNGNIDTTFKNTSHINTLFALIIAKLTEKTNFYFYDDIKKINDIIESDNLSYDRYITYKFINKEPILKYKTINEHELKNFINTIINNTIVWIITCFKDNNFIINSENLLFNSENLLFKNYDIFLNSYSKLILLTENYSYLAEQIKQDIKGIEAYKQILLGKLKKKLTLYSNNTNNTNDYNEMRIAELMSHTYNATKEEELIEFLKKIKYIKDKKNSLEDFKSLDEFNKFIKSYDEKSESDKYHNYIYLIHTKLKNEIIKKDGYGNQNINIILNTPILYLYKVLTYSGSMYYGSGTSWCVSKTNQDGEISFNKHIKDNDIYIIQKKDTNPDPDLYILQKSKNKYIIEFNRDNKQFVDAAKDCFKGGDVPENIIKTFENNKNLVDFFSEFKYDSDSKTQKIITDLKTSFNSNPGDSV